MQDDHSKTGDPSVGSTRLVRMRRDRDVLALERCCKALWTTRGWGEGDSRM
jgi:hypothetical protein